VKPSSHNVRLCAAMIEITIFNPAPESDGSITRALVDCLGDGLHHRRPCSS